MFLGQWLHFCYTFIDFYFLVSENGFKKKKKKPKKSLNNYNQKKLCTKSQGLYKQYKRIAKLPCMGLLIYGTNEVANN